jgi:predicted lipid-binding transport protein (Tim44 family)
MNDNTPQTPSTSGGTPIQDKVTPPTSNTPAASTPAASTPTASAPPVKAPAVKAAARPKGPNASGLVVGLVAMLIAGLIIAKETMNLHVDWSKLGPATIVGMGVVMVAIGAIGLVRRHDNV